MTLHAPARRARRPRGRRGRARVPGPLLAVLLAAATFAVGVALGQTLGEDPDTGQTQTFVRTLRPLPLSAERTTVTATVTSTVTAGIDD